MNQADINLLLNQIKNIEQGIPASNNVVFENKDLETINNALLKLSNTTSNANQFLENLLNDNYQSTIEDNVFYSQNALAINKKFVNSISQKSEVNNDENNFIENYPFSFSDFLNILNSTSEWIVALDAETFEVIYANDSANAYFFSEKEDPDVMCGCSCMVFDYFSQMIEPDQDNALFEYFCPFSEKRLLVKAFLSNWNGKPTYITYIDDVTNEVQYQELAYSDELTGIFNRRYFIKKMKSLLEDKTAFSLSIIDMDGLKFANDTYGHNVGDTYIKSVVTSVKNAFIYNITLCRIGGDEFALISEKINPSGIDEKLASVNIKFSRQDNLHPMSVSFGTIYVNSFDKKYSELIKEADDIMYEHKKNKKAQRQD